MDTYTIGQLASAAGVNVETVRYYENRGIIDQPGKPLQGFRQYPEETLIRILFVKRAQQLGFTLSEILTLLAISSGHCDDIKEIAESKLALIQNKITDLKQLEESLSDLIGECRRNSDAARCPIIESLAHDKNF